MAVGFGYIRDKKPTQVDWAELSRQAREGIKGIEDDRKERSRKKILPCYL